jgi:hypothetical protein
MGTRQIGLLDIVHGGRHSRVRLLAPLRYLLIRHPEKYRYDVLVPVLTGVAFWVGYLLIEPKPKLFGDAGLLRFARDLLISGAVHGGRSGRRLNGRAGRPHGPAAGGLGAVLGRRAAHAPAIPLLPVGLSQLPRNGDPGRRRWCLFAQRYGGGMDDDLAHIASRNLDDRDVDSGVTAVGTVGHCALVALFSDRHR